MSIREFWNECKKEFINIVENESIWNLGIVGLAFFLIVAVVVCLIVVMFRFPTLLVGALIITSPWILATILKVAYSRKKKNG